MSERPVDPEPRDRLRGWGGDDLLDEMTESFREQVPELLGRARRGIEDGMWRDVERAAHTLRSSAAQLGAVRMEVVSSRIEGLAARNELRACGPLIPALEDEFDRYVEWIRREDRDESPSGRPSSSRRDSSIDIQ